MIGKCILIIVVFRKEEILFAIISNKKQSL